MMIPRLALTTLLLTLCAFTGAGAEEAVTVVRVEDLERLIPQREWWEGNLLAIGGALVGAALGAFLGARWNHHFNDIQSKENIDITRANLRKALRAELNNITSKLMGHFNQVGDRLEDIDEEHIYGIQAGTVLYQQSADIIQLLDPDELEAVIDAYSAILGIYVNKRIQKAPSSPIVSVLFQAMFAKEKLGMNPEKLAHEYKKLHELTSPTVTLYLQHNIVRFIHGYATCRVQGDFQFDPYDQLEQ